MVHADPHDPRVHSFPTIPPREVQELKFPSSCDAPPRKPTVTSRSFVSILTSSLSSISSPSSKTELWPALFHLQIMNQRPLLREIHDWVKAHPVPMCMFMPDRLPDANAHRTNQMAFDELASLLMQNQWVSSWSLAWISVQKRTHVLVNLYV